MNNFNNDCENDLKKTGIRKHMRNVKRTLDAINVAKHLNT